MCCYAITCRENYAYLVGIFVKLSVQCECQLEPLTPADHELAFVHVGEHVRVVGRRVPRHVVVYGRDRQPARWCCWVCNSCAYQ